MNTAKHIIGPVDLGINAFGYAGMVHLYNYPVDLPEDFNLDLVNISVRAFNDKTKRFRKLPKRVWSWYWGDPMVKVTKGTKRFVVKFDPYQLLLMGFSINTQIDIVVEVKE